MNLHSVITEAMASDWDTLDDLKARIMRAISSVPPLVVKERVERQPTKKPEKRWMPLHSISAYMHQSDLTDEQIFRWANIVLRAENSALDGRGMLIDRHDATVILAVEAMLRKYLPLRDTRAADR